MQDAKMSHGTIFNIFVAINHLSTMHPRTVTQGWLTPTLVNMEARLLLANKEFSRLEDRDSRLDGQLIQKNIILKRIHGRIKSNVLPMKSLKPALQSKIDLGIALTADQVKQTDKVSANSGIF